MENIFTRIECDKALLKLKNGDSSNLTLLYELVGRKMYALAFSILNNREDAEDALQEAFLKIQENIREYDKSRNGYNWVLTITRNISIDILRNRKPILNIDDYSDSEKASVLYPIDDRLIIGEALQHLDETDREIIVLKSFSMLKYREISKITGLSVDVVEKRYQRSLIKMKEYLVSK